MEQPQRTQKNAKENHETIEQDARLQVQIFQSVVISICALCVLCGYFL
jgi:hypothetical protein